MGTVNCVSKLSLGSKLRSQVQLGNENKWWAEPTLHFIYYK
jgi:hypothetical protein